MKLLRYIKTKISLDWDELLFPIVTVVILLGACFLAGIPMLAILPLFIGNEFIIKFFEYQQPSWPLWYDLFGFTCILGFITLALCVVSALVWDWGRGIYREYKEFE